MKVPGSGQAESEKSMEMDSGSYKKKVEQLTVLVRHYQAELESQKMRRDGVETVSRLLAEARQENLLLRQNQQALETTVKNLQNRLTVSGVTVTSAGEEDEVIVPGTSKQTLTNLALENKRLRSMLQQSPNAPPLDEEGHNKLTEQHEDLVDQVTLEKLEAENQSMKKKLQDLEELFKASNNDKDRQLIEYYEQLQTLRKQTKGGEKMEGEDSNRNAPAANVPGLKEQLQAFIGQCQQFATNLDLAANTADSKLDVKPAAREAVERADSHDGTDVQQLLEERQKLQDRVEDVTKMNQRWQEFYTEREKHIQQLEEKVASLDERLKEAMRAGPADEINRRIEQVLEKAQKDTKQVEELRRKAEDEVERLEQELVSKDTQVAQLQSQLSIMSRTHAHKMSADTSSTIEHLKAQIQVCTEDFEKERQDRQVALQKVASLQEQNTHLQQQNMHLQKLNSHLQTMINNQLGQGTRPMPQDHSQHPQHPPHDVHNLQPRGPRYPQTSPDHDSPDRGSSYQSYSLQDPVSGMKAVPAPTRAIGGSQALVSRGVRTKHVQSDSALYQRAGKPENFLTCPKCNQEFSEEHQGELLAHMDMCCE